MHMQMDIFIKEFCRFYKNNPIVLVDVGAHGGLQKNWLNAKEYLQVIGFEPNKESYDQLICSEDNKQITYFNSGLYDKNTEVDLNISNEVGCSSVYEADLSFISDFPFKEDFTSNKSCTMSVDKLDDLLKSKSIDEVDFIKIDAQGTELSILKGSQRIIEDTVFGLEIEVEFVEIYKKQPTFSDVDNFTREKGFYLFDLQLYYWKRNKGRTYGRNKGQLIFANALYLRTKKSFLEILDKISGDESKKSKVLKALSICFLYGYFDYALEILDFTENLFDKEEYNIICKRIKRGIIYKFNWNNVYLFLRKKKRQFDNLFLCPKSGSIADLNIGNL